MVKASLFQEQLMEFLLGSLITENVGMPFVLHQRERTFEQCVEARFGTRVIEGVGVSEAVRGCGYYFVVAEIERTE